MLPYFVLLPARRRPSWGSLRVTIVRPSAVFADWVPKNERLG